MSDFLDMFKWLWTGSPGGIHPQTFGDILDEMQDEVDQSLSSRANNVTSTPTTTQNMSAIDDMMRMLDGLAGNSQQMFNVSAVRAGDNYQQPAVVGTGVVDPGPAVAIGSYPNPFGTSDLRQAYQMRTDTVTTIPATTQITGGSSGNAELLDRIMSLQRQLIEKDNIINELREQLASQRPKGDRAIAL